MEQVISAIEEQGLVSSYEKMSSEAEDEVAESYDENGTVISYEELVDIVGEDAVASSTGNQREYLTNEEESLSEYLEDFSEYTVESKSIEGDVATLSCKVEQPDLETWMQEVMDGTRKPTHGYLSADSVKKSVIADLEDDNMPYRTVEVEIHYEWIDKKWELQVDEDVMDVVTCGLMSSYNELIQQTDSEEK